MVDAAGDIHEAPPVRTRRRTLRLLAWVVAAVAAGLLVWAIEAGSPEGIAATGVDELVIPWPDPAPGEFVDQINNPWLSLSPGAEWVHVGQVDDLTMTRTTTVLTEPREIAGIAATVVRVQQGSEGSPGSDSVRFYAQDRRGNVWLLGEEGVWQVGPDVPAGLAMAAEPRRGDASIRVPLTSTRREVVRIGESGTAVTVPAGTFTDLRGVTEIYGLPATSQVEVLLARGVGEVVRTWGPGNRLELESYRPGE